MKITTYGTRGSLPVAGRDMATYGGNTTSLRVESACLPSGLVLAIDAGSGFRPLATQALAQDMRSLVLLHTHWHHDHTQGALIAAPFYIPTLPIAIYGPVEMGMGPREVYEAIMRKPLHPVDFATVAHHISCHKIEHPSIKVFLVHPQGGLKLMDIEQFNRHENNSAQMPFGKDRYHLSECMVIKMLYTDHPERTISYRFEERPTGKVFVFLTDEECRAALPQDFKRHLGGADLLIQDVQYSQEQYETRTAGFGHGTPGYAVSVATLCGISRIGFTHHDPNSADDDVDRLVEEGQQTVGDALTSVFACADAMEIEV